MLLKESVLRMVTSPETYYVVAFVTSFSGCSMVSCVSKFARVNMSLHPSFSLCSLSLPNNMKNSFKKAKIKAATNASRTEDEVFFPFRKQI